MPSSQQAANATTSTVQSDLHGIERAKQEQGAPGATQTSRVYKDHKGQSAETDDGLTLDGLTLTGGDKLESVPVQKVSQAANHLQAQASAKIDDAAAQGQHDVEETKATTASYLNQAKTLAGTALGSAQDALHRGAVMVAPADPSVPGIVATLQATTSNALEAAGGYLASTQAALTSQAPQEKKQGVTEVLDDAKISTTGTTDNVVVSAQSAASEPSQAEPSQAASNANTKTVVQPHVEAAKQTASSLINSAAQTAATTLNVASTQTQGTKAAISGYTTAATEAAQAYTPKPQEGVHNSQQGPVTPVSLPAEGIEGVLMYGEDKSNSAKQQDE